MMYMLAAMGSFGTISPFATVFAWVTGLSVSGSDNGVNHYAEGVSLFCLVHGSTQNATCWDLLIPKLEEAGHQCVRMNLPTDTPEASATHYAGIIAEAIPADRDDAIVVAHSASGLFLPLVPERRRVRRMVFLAAIVPQIGKSLTDQVKDDKGMFNPEWLGKDPTKDAQIALHFLFHD